MPFNLKETCGGLDHLKLGLERRLFGRAQNYFVEKLRREGLSLETVKKSDGSPAVCHICGYALAEMEMNGGWTIRACSATEPFARKCGTFDLSRASREVCQKKTSGKG